MGKTNPGKWLKKVKNAFRSPSKERTDGKDEAQIKPLKVSRATSLDYSKAVPTPLPLPSVAGLMHQEIESERNNGLSRDEAVSESESNKVHDHRRQEAMPSDVDEEVEDNKEDETLREEQAAIQIQRAFRNHLALKGLVRLQALVRGHTVRRQAATTLRAMEALVRVQARVRARRVRMSEEGQAVQQQILQRRLALTRPKPSEGSWITGQDSKEKMQIREEAARKRERAMAYAFSQQLKRSTPKKNMLFIDSEPDQSHWGWSWMDRWMAARPWENRHIDHTKEGHQSISSVKFLESKPKNIKIDGMSLKSARPTPPPTSRIDKSEEKPKKGHRANGVSGNIPLPLPSPPPSADEPLIMKPDVQRKTLLPEKPAVSSRQEVNHPASLPPVEVLGSAGTDSDAAPPSPTDSSTFNRLPHSSYPDSNEGPVATSNDGTLEHDLSCSGSCGSEHGTNEQPSTKANPQDSPIPDHIEAEIDAANAPHDEKEGENGEISLRASQKSTRSRYMSPTVSAKAKARTSPKTRVEGEESPAKQQKRLSFGSPSVGRPKSPNLNAAARSKSISQVSHCLRVFQSAFAFLNTV
ncbi:hypothetical protein KC19_4G002600 [Ceratodon purpureus]|uniref:DUF4005 domain-containing protein n=2 Tax=Ceratodon purpureus TaxID=3225 RepID=A0A8T0I3T8_CERPU|nr:hypothetical protein KC19_4G002600 [Ceratodon purpureus]